MTLEQHHINILQRIHAAPGAFVLLHDLKDVDPDALKDLFDWDLIELGPDLLGYHLSYEGHLIVEKRSKQKEAVTSSSPDLPLSALLEMLDRFGRKKYHRYAFLWLLLLALAFTLWQYSVPSSSPTTDHQFQEALENIDFETLIDSLHGLRDSLASDSLRI